MHTFTTKNHYIHHIYKYTTYIHIYIHTNLFQICDLRFQNGNGELFRLIVIVPGNKGSLVRLDIFHNALSRYNGCNNDVCVCVKVIA